MSISVIIPVFNGVHFVRKAYDGIIRQEQNDIEIIYIDNNSTDNSIDQIKEIQAFDKRVKLFMQPIQGAAAARNKGMEQAKGDYIYMFDVDDQIYPGALKALQKVLNENSEVDAVFGKMIKSYKGIQHIEKPKDETNQVSIKEKPYWGLRWFSDLRTVVGPPAFLYRREVFDTVGTYNVSLHTGEDTALDIKLGMLCNVAFIDRYIYLYLKHNTSTTDRVKKQTDRSFMQWPRFTKSHVPFYMENPVPMEFKKILFKGLYGSFGRMLNLTSGFRNRNALKKQLFKDIDSIKTPWLLRSYLNVLVFFNFSYVFKFYIYYLIPKLLPYIIKINDKQLKSR